MANTRISHFRLKEDTLTELDQIAQHLTRTTGVDHSRADAIRASARRLYTEVVAPTELTAGKKIQKKP